MSSAANLPPASVLRPELRARLERLEHLERRERQGRYARWHIPAPVERESEGWLLTYLDLITLLLVMLVVMLAFSQPKVLEPEAVAVAVAGTPAQPVQALEAETEPETETQPDPSSLPTLAEPQATDTADMPLADTQSTQSDTAAELAPTAPFNAHPMDTDLQLEGGHDRPAPRDVALVGSVRSSQSLQTALPSSYDLSSVSPAGMPVSAGGNARDQVKQTGSPDPAQDAAQPQYGSPSVPAHGSLSAPTQASDSSPASESAATLAPSLEDLGLNGLGENIDVIINEESVSFRINNEILFTSGQADLMPSGLDVLTRLAAVLARNDYQIAVEGHTDPVPIQNERFPSNWELSTGRATSVLRHLQSQGIPAGRLRATGYADTRPIAPNDSSAGRAFNRRVELIMEMPRGARKASQSSSSVSADGAMSLPGSDFSGPVVRLR